MSAMARALAMPAIVPVSATVPVGFREWGAVWRGHTHHPSTPPHHPTVSPHPTGTHLRCSRCRCCPRHLQETRAHERPVPPCHHAGQPGRERARRGGGSMAPGAALDPWAGGERMSPWGLCCPTPPPGAARCFSEGSEAGALSHCVCLRGALEGASAGDTSACTTANLSPPSCAALGVQREQTQLERCTAHLCHHRDVTG